MLNFGITKQGFHIAVSFDEDTADNSVVITVNDGENEPLVVTGAIVLDS